MFRRFFRIFCVVGLVVIVAMAVVGQFAIFFLRTPSCEIATGPGGVGLIYTRPEPPMPAFPNVPAFGTNSKVHNYGTILLSEWRVRDLFELPTFQGGRNKLVSLPWWLLLAAWILLTALVWRLTRRCKIGHGFPIEPTVKSP